MLDIKHGHCQTILIEYDTIFDELLGLYTCGRRINFPIRDADIDVILESVSEVVDYIVNPFRAINLECPLSPSKCGHIAGHPQIINADDMVRMEVCEEETV